MRVAAFAGVVGSSSAEVETRGPIARGEDHLGVGVGFRKVETGWHRIGNDRPRNLVFVCIKKS